MKKRLLALLLALSMLMTCAMPGFAAEGISDSDISGSDTSDSDISDSDASGITDEDIKMVFDAHKAEKEALAGSNLSKVIETFEGFVDAAEIFNEFEDEHMAKLADLIGCSIDDTYGEILSVHMNAGIINEMAGKIEAFTSNPDQSTAKDFVDYHDILVDDPDYDDTEEIVRRFFTDLDDTYTEAMELLPSKEILKVFNAYENILSAMESHDLDILRDAMDENDRDLGAIMDMSEEDDSELGKMMGLEGESAYSRIIDVITTCEVIIKMGERYNEYVENSFDNKAASAFVVYYDYIFEDTSNGNDELCKLVRAFFYDIDSQYAKANAVSVGQQFVRLSGKNRTATSVVISKEGFINSEFVVIASGENYADALAGVPLAYGYDAPVLLVSNNSSDKAVYDEIERLGATDIFILGGKAAVGADVQERLENMGCTVQRVSGKTRYETAVEIAITVINNDSECEEVFFVCAENYPDALSVSNVAALNGDPILFIGKNGELNSTVAEFIRERGVKKATIIGGTGAIGAAAEGNIKACGVENVERIYGKDRYATCLEILRKYDGWMYAKTLCIATGENFPDALAGGAFSVNLGAKLLLVDNKSLSEAQIEYIADIANERGWNMMYVFGGSGVVSDEIAESIVDVITENFPIIIC